MAFFLNSVVTTELKNNSAFYHNNLNNFNKKFQLVNNAANHPTVTKQISRYVKKKLHPNICKSSDFHKYLFPEHVTR